MMKTNRRAFLKVTIGSIAAPLTICEAAAQEKTSYLVNWNGAVLQFQSGSGLGVMQGESTQGNIRMPGREKLSTAIFENGIYQSNTRFQVWLGQAKAKPSQIAVSLVDNNGKPIVSWTITNAFLSNISPGNLKSDGNRVQIGSISITHGPMIQR